MGRGHETKVLSPSQAVDFEHATHAGVRAGRVECIVSTGTVVRRFETHLKGGPEMREILRRLWQADEAQDIAEYAVMLAVILVIVVGTIRLIGANANNVFSSVASSISQ
jgi:Flp pilus assembly pilin Flp